MLQLVTLRKSTKFDQGCPNFCLILVLDLILLLILPLPLILVLDVTLVLTLPLTLIVVLDIQSLVFQRITRFNTIVGKSDYKWDRERKDGP